MTLVGGELAVRSTAGNGTIVTARVPLYVEDK
jgi:signal transduction histidine kinase